MANNYGDQFDINGEQSVWNASSLKAWEKCPRYYFYTIIEGWRSRGNESVHLTFGSHYAHALMRYWQLRAEGMTRMDATCEVVRELLERTWDRSHRYNNDGYCEYCGAGMGQLDDDGEFLKCRGRPWTTDHAKARFTLIRSFVWYLEEFRQDIPLMQTADGPAVELQFRFAVDGDNFFVGTLDRVVEYDGAPWVMDQKTTGSALGPYYFNGYHLDTQMSMYTFAGQAVFNLPVAGVIIDAAEIKVGFTRFGRGLTYRTPSQLNEWYDEAMQQIEDARRAVREQRFPRRTTSCGNYGGCTFREICSKPKEVRGNFLRSAFTKEKK